MAIALVAAALGVVWWSGIGAPRISIAFVEANPERAILTVANDGRAAIDLRDATFDDPRLEGETVELPADAIGGGESVELVVRYLATCPPTPKSGYYIPLRITADTVLGLGRTITAGEVGTIGDHVCGKTIPAPGEGSPPQAPRFAASAIGAGSKKLTRLVANPSGPTSKASIARQLTGPPPSVPLRVNSMNTPSGCGPHRWT